MRTADFDYLLPQGRIAQTPTPVRDQSRLLDARDLSDHLFTDLPILLQPGDLVVINRSRVRAARLRGFKNETGGAVEILLLRRVDASRWEALLRPARRLRAGAHLVCGPIEAALMSDPIEGAAVVELWCDGDIEEAIAIHGELPLPPYIRRRLDDPDRYQTVFAGSVGSAAAPTAGLHFTPEVVAALAARQVPVVEIELEVGLDTFRPITRDLVEDHVIHRERYLVPDATAREVNVCRRSKGRIVAVGTTVVRTLESQSTETGELLPGRGETSLYLTPGSPFRVVDLLVTNFHAPRTTLLVLLAAFMGPEWRTVYDHALAGSYRFLSFGDAMLAARSA